MMSKILWAIAFTIFTFCNAERDINITSDAEKVSEGLLISLRKSFQLTCNVTNASNETEIEWFFNNKLLKETKRIKIYDDNNTLVVNNAKETDCGVYTCQTSDLELNETVFVQSKPHIRPSFSVASMNKIEGEKLRINCTAEGSPKPQIHWLKNGAPVRDINDTRYSFEGNLTESVLIVVDLEASDEANYTCVATSATGTTSESIFISVKDKLAALWPFLGIVVEVTILCIIIFVYEKRRAKQEDDESDTDQNPETKNMNEKDNVRQRK